VFENFYPFYIIAFILLVVLAGLVFLLRRVMQYHAVVLDRMDLFERMQVRLEGVVRDEIVQNREELGKSAREQRQELFESFKHLGDSVGQRMNDAATIQRSQLDNFSNQLSKFVSMSTERLDRARDESTSQAQQLREEVIKTLSGISETITKSMAGFSDAQQQQLATFSNNIKQFTDIMARISESNEKKLEAIRSTVENKLKTLQEDNARQLEEMRKTVDEKLQGTLEKRLGESFKQVSERLEMVHKGLGEMQTLASGVGDLKKVLTNVKTRGIWGEVQLGALLEQVLTPDQFAVNVATKDAGERVEFAVKLPGQGTDTHELVWLPIDAKFPVEDYQRLLEAQESSDPVAVEALGKQLEARVRGCAADISKKYLNPPKTTDFGILFLPIEGLFAEVIRRTGLVETIQREFRVVIAGPTTLWSILNSLQMGFRTLAIQKRSSEVWNLLAAVKTEFSKYGEILEAVQKKLHQASDAIDKAKIRTRAVNRKLKDVQELPLQEARALLPMDLMEDEANEDRGQD